jgi:hypothetical protein
VIYIHLGNFRLLFICLYQELFKKDLVFFGLFDIAIVFLTIVKQVFGPFCGLELLVSFLAYLVVIVVRQEVDHRVLVLD